VSDSIRVPLVDLRAAFEPIRERFLAELEIVLEGMQLSYGPHQRAFEREFAAFCEAAEGVAVASGTAALGAALRAADLGPGAEVIVPSQTFFASVEAVLRIGATPVLVDVEPDTLTVDPAAIRAALSDATQAILPVHLYGHPADMDPILELAHSRGLVVIEDAAQAHGARYRGRRCGSLGDAGCFSFYFTKNLGALGEGGFVTTGDPTLAEALRRLRDHGRSSKFEHVVLGDNLRMDEIQALVLRLQLERLEERNARRRELAARYVERFAGTPVRTLATRTHCEPAHQVFPVRVPRRDALREHLARQGIETGVHYAIPAHRQPALRAHPHRLTDLAVTERACAEVLSLPLHPELDEDQLEYVVKQVLRFFEGDASRPRRREPTPPS
jgi:dTDP-4-amino-4,6-dideoxygalactose transaminase